MIDRTKRAWEWFVGGLTEAGLAVLERASGSGTHRIVVGEGEAVVEGPDGAVIGAMAENEGAVRPRPLELAARLARARIDILVPPSWMFRRDLDPVAVQSVPFLDAFVRHQIERITPWRVADVYYRVATQTLPADPARVGVAVSVVPRRLVDGWVAAVELLRPRRLRILSRSSQHPDAGAITLGDGAVRLARALRRKIVLGLGVAAVCLLGALGWLWWQTAAVEDDIAEQDRILDERKAVLARANRLTRGGDDIEAKLRQMRDARPRAVDLIEALASALPDSAHLTDLALRKSDLTIRGISTDTPVLVPALEKSGRFADVAFGASTTRVESGQGDRFQLDMRVRDAVPGEPAPGAP